MARSERGEKPLAAIMIDVDHFKRINDRIGHQGGDQVLIEVTNRVASTLRSADMLGRIGGEEFLIILYPADLQTASDVMERARLACASRPVVVESGEFDVTISLGAAVVDDFEDVDLAVVLKTADHALYRAKEGGRDRFEVESI
jgi:diguanylate cyclase (GGDEF)-like protein